MTCRNCGTEIADKAIVCYRCGTGTAEPVRKAVEIPRRRPLAAPVRVLLVLVLLVLALLAWFVGEHYHLIGLELLIDFPSIHA